MEVIGMHNQNIIAISVIAFTLYSSVSAAQENDTGISARLMGVLAHDDNIYRVTDEFAQADSYLRLSPRLSTIGGVGKHRFSLIYNGDYAKFSDNDEANYNDHELSGRIDFSHSLRLNTTIEVGYQKDHEDPGSINRIQLDITEYNKFNQSYILTGLTYGSKNSIGLVTLNYKRTDKKYTTNNLDFWNFESDQIYGRFTVRVAPNTQVYAEAIIADYDYTPGTNFELDNSYNRYLAGVTWDFTGKLTGDLNIGYQERDYDLVSIEDISGLAYEAELTWNLNTYTKLVGGAKRESIDSTLDEAGGFLRNTYSINLNHELSERMKLVLGAAHTTDELVFISSREDKRYDYQFGLEYDLMKNLAIAASYIYEERDSTQLTADFKANIFSLTVIVSLED